LSTDQPSAERVAVGRIGRAHGLHGAVIVDPLTDRPVSRFSRGSVVYLDDGTPLTVASFEATDRSPLITFTDVSDREHAEQLRGRELFIDADQRRPLEDEEFWPDELVGMDVVDADGVVLGMVAEVEAGGAQDRLVIDAGAASFTVPFVAELVTHVDVEARKVIVDLPEGLTD
jgi:16S rRNA processing protein RimM